MANDDPFEFKEESVVTFGSENIVSEGVCLQLKADSINNTVFGSSPIEANGI